MDQSGTKNPAYKHGGKIGKRTSRAYGIYRAMLNRCRLRTSPDWKWYGALGVRVCDRWQGADGFINFLADMGEPAAGMSIDRWPDRDGNYGPENCRWATQQQQQRNRRNNKRLAFNGETLTLAEWDERLGFGVSRRIRNGWSVEDALTIPKGKKGSWIQRTRDTKVTTGVRHTKVKRVPISVRT